MADWQRATLAFGLAVAFTACGDDTSSDGGADARMDAGLDGGDAGADAETDADAGADGACRLDEDCPDGQPCINAAQFFGLGTGYCAVECSADADCGALEADGFSYACLPWGDEMRCLRSCDGGFGCPEGSVCQLETAGGEPLELCVDLRADACASDADCDEDESCAFVYDDRERVVSACFVARNASGRPRESRRAGAECDPRGDIFDEEARVCMVEGDCPSGWGCQSRSADPEYGAACLPSDAEQCMLALESGQDSDRFSCHDPELCGCLAEGYCGGLCADDADCGGSMRCSLTTYRAIRHGTRHVFDDTLSVAGFCSYAEGSRTPCVREVDCATSGPGGTRESCKLGSDASGAVAGVCVAPPAGFALPGESCGDDPSTPEREPQACVNECIAGHCAAACVDDSDCPSGTECLERFIDAERTARSCTPTAPACERDADCVAPEACQLVVGPAGAFGVCGPPGGELGAGERCSHTPAPERPSQHCAALSCRRAGRLSEGGLCTALCQTDADCPADFRCRMVEATVRGGGTLDRTDDVTASWRECEWAPGSRQTCRTTADCPELTSYPDAAGYPEVCVATSDVDGAPVRICIVAAQHDVIGFGDPCTIDFCPAWDQCIRDWLTGSPYCSQLCDSDADCGDTGLVCRRFFGDQISLDRSMCVRPDDPRGSPL